MKNPLTASERRGILVVAALALIITGTGWVVSMCQRPTPTEPLPELEVLARGDSLSDDSVGKRPGRKKGRRRSRKDSIGGKGKKAPKQYRRRNPLDEGVGAKHKLSTAHR